jgi:hypothetical protein
MWERLPPGVLHIPSNVASVMAKDMNPMICDAIAKLIVKI